MPKDFLTWEKLSHVLITIAVATGPYVGYELTNFRQSVDGLKDVLTELKIQIAATQEGNRGLERRITILEETRCQCPGR